VLTRQELAPRREQITQRLTGLAPERQQIEPQRDTTIQWEHIASNIEHFRTLLGSPVDRWCFEDRQTVIQLWVEKVVVSRDGAVEGHHVLPFEEQPVAADQKKKGIPPAFYVLRLQHLDLETRGIEFHQFMTMQLRISRAQHNDPRLGRVLPVEEHHQAQATLQRFVPHPGSIQRQRRFICYGSEVLETVQGLEVDFPVILPPCPASLRVRTGVEKAAIPGRV
jgi:hypothetical protein